MRETAEERSERLLKSIQEQKIGCSSKRNYEEDMQDGLALAKQYDIEALIIKKPLIIIKLP